MPSVFLPASACWNIPMASILRAQTPRMNAFFMVSSYVSRSACRRETSKRAASKASVACRNK